MVPCEDDNCCETLPPLVCGCATTSRIKYVTVCGVEDDACEHCDTAKQRSESSVVSPITVSGFNGRHRLDAVHSTTARACVWRVRYKSGRTLAPCTPQTPGEQAWVLTVEDIYTERVWTLYAAVYTDGSTLGGEWHVDATNAAAVYQLTEDTDSDCRQPKVLSLIDYGAYAYTGDCTGWPADVLVLDEQNLDCEDCSFERVERDCDCHPDWGCGPQAWEVTVPQLNIDFADVPDLPMIPAGTYPLCWGVFTDRVYGGCQWTSAAIPSLSYPGVDCRIHLAGRNPHHPNSQAGYPWRPHDWILVFTSNGTGGIFGGTYRLAGNEWQCEADNVMDKTGGGDSFPAALTVSRSADDCDAPPATGGCFDETTESCEEGVTQTDCESGGKTWLGNLWTFTEKSRSRPADTSAGFASPFVVSWDHRGMIVEPKPPADVDNPKSRARFVSHAEGS